MSDFVLLFRTTEAEQQEHMGTPEVAQQSMQAWLAWVRGLDAKGHLKDPGQPLEMGGKVVGGGGKIVTDGPYAETKDLLLGFMIITAHGLDEAVTLAKTCPMLDGSGSVEVRPVGQLDF